MHHQRFENHTTVTKNNPNLFGEVVTGKEKLLECGRVVRQVDPSCCTQWYTERFTMFIYPGISPL